MARSADHMTDNAGTRPGSRLRHLLRTAGRIFGQALGVPDYEAYVAHHRQHHPQGPLMSREQFYRNRQQARYTGGQGRCC